MANETDDLTLRMRTRGMRQGAREVDRTSRSLGRMSKASNVSLRSFTKLGGGLRAVGSGVAAVGIAGGTMAAVLGVQAVNAASDLNEEINKTQAVFGKSAGGILAWSKGSATAFGQSRRQALGAAGAIGSLLIPMGFAPKRAAAMSKRMTVLASDMASFSNTSPQEALDAIRSGLVGEMEPLRKYGVSLNDAALKQKATNMGLYKGKGQLTASAKAAATYGLVIDRLNKSHTAGDFARTRHSFANQMRTLGATWEDLKAAVGGPLLSVVNKGLKDLLPPLTHVTNVASDVFSNKNLKWDQKFRLLGQSIKHWFGPIANDMVQGLRDAHLDRKLNALIKWTSPQISQAFATVAPMAATAFIGGFKAAPVWAQALTALWLFGKTKPMWDGLGKLAGAASCGKLKGNMGACLGKSGAPAGAASFGAKLGRAVGMAAWPIALALLVNELSSNEPGKQAESANPEGVRAHHRIAPGDGPTGAQIYGRRTHDPIPANTEASRGYRGIPQPAAPIRRKGADTHVTVEVDGKAVATATARATKREKARR